MEITMHRPAIILALFLLLVITGCLGPGQAERPVISPSPLPETTTLPAVVTTIPPPPSPPQSLTPSLVSTTIPPTKPPAPRTSTPVPTPTPVSDETLNARMVDARNKLSNLMESDVADTIVINPGNSQDCEVKMSRELGYLIDTTTGESTFVKGDYWSIDTSLFSRPMKKDREYVIIHTHPRMWTICRTSGITSLYTFSIGDLEATSDLTGQGYHIRTLVAISDKEYRIAPGIKDGWRSKPEIHEAIARIEKRLEAPFSYYDATLQHQFYDVDNLMPLLAKELNYTYSANGVKMA
jgi:hypothetical protein